MTENYPMLLEWNEAERVYVVTFPDLRGCVADGATPDEAVREATRAKDLWLDFAREQGQAIPPPRRLER